MKKPKFPLAPKKKNSIPIWLVAHGDLGALEGKLSAEQFNWAKFNGFDGKTGTTCHLPSNNGTIGGVLFGFSPSDNPLEFGALYSQLKSGNYHLEAAPDDEYNAYLGFLLGAYKFERYKKIPVKKVTLALSKSLDNDKLRREAAATYLVRDLINTPTNDMGPNQLEKIFRKIGTDKKAKVNVIKGPELLKKNFPMIHAVGRASAQAPRLLDLVWGKSKNLKVTLVGKGVCFDTGGLNIKPGNSMALMKKDMGGAANVLGLAQLIMEAQLPVRLRVLIPAVENSISADAFRPGDVLLSRKGISVEIGNTDAEGRLVLGDALAYADEEDPDLLIDMATLTGAARVALGPDLPPYYTDNEVLSGELSNAAEKCHDPLWRMPLWEPYSAMLRSKIADINHITSGGFAGSVTAALFLKKFVKLETTWAHFDVFGWVPSSKPWASVGGEAQGIRALFEVIESLAANQ